MKLKKQKRMSVSKLTIYGLILIFFCVKAGFSESMFNLEDEFFSPDNELDLSIDLNKLDDISTRPNFTGIWVLNHSVSDDPKQVLNKMKHGKNGPPGAGKASGSGPGGMGRDKPGNGRPEGMSRSMDGFRPNKNVNQPELLKKLLINELVIRHNEPLFRINMERIYTDLRGSSISVLGGANQSVSFAGWEGNSLVVETTKDNGSKINERFTLLSNPQRLERITEIVLREQKNNTVHIKQIYALKNHSVGNYNNSALSFYY